MVGRPSKRSESCRETLWEVWKWSRHTPNIGKWSGDPPGGPEMVVRLSRISRSGQDTHLEGWKWSGDPLKGL